MPGFIGLPELLLLGLLALILFGPKRLPEMGRGLGKGMREFKESISGEHKDTVEVHPLDIGADMSHLSADLVEPLPVATAHVETVRVERVRDEEKVA